MASLNTVISTGGVAVGVMALIVVLGVMNGLRDDLRERILVANPAPPGPDLRRRAPDGRLAQGARDHPEASPAWWRRRPR